MSGGARLGTILITVVCLFSLGGAAVLLWFADTAADPVAAPEEPPAGPAEPRASDAPRPVSVPVQAVPTPKVASGAGDGPVLIDLPDGTSVPNLNGVEVKVRFTWTPRRPYSPIVGRLPASGQDGWEWYQHADGTLSTTAMVWRSDLGRKDATHVVVAPAEAAPLDPRLAQKMYEEGLMGANPPGGVGAPRK